MFSRSVTASDLRIFRMGRVTVDRQLILELAMSLRERVLPALGSLAGRRAAGGGAGGDVTFAIDQIAEAELSSFVADRAPRLAFYSEDRGLVAPDDADAVLVVDP